jgi:hypothetical protein
MKRSPAEAACVPVVLQIDLDKGGAPVDTDVADMTTAGTEGNHCGTPELLIVSGPLGLPRVMAQAVQVATRQARHVVRIAIRHVEQGDADVSALYAAFDRVFLVSRPEREALVRHLYRTLSITGDIPGWISCEWNAVRHILRPECAASEDRRSIYGFAASLGEQRPGAVWTAASARIAHHGASLNEVGGLCCSICAASPALLGKELKGVFSHLVAEMDSTSALAISMGWDSRLAPGSVEVAIFAFGARARARATSLSASLEPAPLGAWGQPEAPDCTEPLYAKARALVLSEGRASISLVQRHLHIGYRHASRLLEAMNGDILNAGCLLSCE